MKRFVSAAAAAFFLVLPTFAMGSPLDPVKVAGELVHRSSDVPAALHGRYLYERKGDPIIELRSDGTGLFQAHGVPAIPIKYWLVADEKGKPAKQTVEGSSNYGHIILLEYGEGGGGNYPAGSFDRWQWALDADGTGCAILLGERFRC